MEVFFVFTHFIKYLNWSWTILRKSLILCLELWLQIQTWTDKDGEENLREIHVTADTNRALINKFVPHSKNFARILAYNGRYNGPFSDTVSFTTPEGSELLFNNVERITSLKISDCVQYYTNCKCTFFFSFFCSSRHCQKFWCGTHGLVCSVLDLASPWTTKWCTNWLPYLLPVCKGHESWPTPRASATNHGP